MTTKPTRVVDGILGAHLDRQKITMLRMVHSGTMSLNMASRWIDAPIRKNHAGSRVTRPVVNRDTRTMSVRALADILPRARGGQSYISAILILDASRGRRMFIAAILKLNGALGSHCSMSAILPVCDVYNPHGDRRQDLKALTLVVDETAPS